MYSKRLPFIINGWASPFIALNEMLKRIETLEMLLKRARKNGAVFQYKSHWKEMDLLIKKHANGQELEEKEVFNI